MPVVFDRAEFPLVTVRYRGAQTLPEFEDYLKALAELYQEGRPFALVCDSRGAEPSPALHRRMQADFIAQHERLIRSLNVGTAFVIESMVLRGGLTAILWMQPLPCPHFVCGDIESARRWARARLSGVGKQERAG